MVNKLCHENNFWKIWWYFCVADLFWIFLGFLSTSLTNIPVSKSLKSPPPPPPWAVHFLFYTSLRALAFEWKIQLRMGRWDVNCSNDRTQVSSSCLGVSYEHTRACSVQSTEKSWLSPISYFIRREATSYDGNKTKQNKTYLANFIFWTS